MKNKLKYILLVLPFLLFNQACTDLTEEAYSDLPAENFIPVTENDVIRVIGPAYTSLRDWLFAWHGYFDTQEECSDIIVTPGRPNGWIDGGVYRNMHQHLWDSEQSHVGSMWTRCYTGINYCNKAIYQIESGVLPVTDEKKPGMLAELKVLRAFYYYILCDNFGNVPIMDKFDVAADFLPEQSTRQQVYDFIINDINNNLPNLSADNSQLYYGRVNKWFAHTLLAKMYINAQVYTGTAKWNECIAQCDSVISSQLYDLEGNFSDVFKADNEASREIIFAIPFKTSTNGDYGWFHVCFKTLHPAQQATYDMIYAPWGGSCGIPQFINTYNANDKRLKDTWVMGQQFASNGDSLYCTIKLPDQPLAYTNYVTNVKLAKEYEGYRIGKFEVSNGIGWGGLNNDFPLFRYADILLMKAECLLRTGDAATAAQLVTQVRQRNFNNQADATVSAADIAAGSSYRYGVFEKGEFVGAEEGGADIQYGRMLDELGWEFAAEARRRQDLIRFGVFTTKSWLSHSPNGEHRTLFPIPEDQLNTNNKLKQNPGY